jgi:hypothetical protein
VSTSSFHERPTGAGSVTAVLVDDLADQPHGLARGTHAAGIGPPMNSKGQPSHENASLED